MLLSRLSVAGAIFLGTTNPDSPFHWFKRDFIDRRDLDLALFHFTIEDNPNLPPEYVAALKKEYTGLWHRRFILGEWCQAEGAVYADQWDEDRCTFTGFTQQVEWWAACDYGTTNPTTFGLYSKDRAGNVWCWSEYWWDSRATKRQKSDEEYVTDYLEWINTSAREVAEDAAGSGFPAPSCRPGHVRLDPSAASLRIAFEKRGIRVDAADNDVLEGIKHVGALLQRGAFRIHKRCKESIREMGSYVWDPKAQARGEDAPVKADDHTQDRHRYALYNPSFAPTEATSSRVRI
jgi:PBSX family phage terminase large subunit